MAFEDDMIEAGYSDEQEYLDSLIDDFEDNYRRQQDRELEYDDDYVHIILKIQTDSRCKLM
jgi:hypothetical protein